ncbi:CsgG/HfaB family protein [Myxococcota bacterium]|nr:CsgG/HfaB family protein [Myxococcota bacterium]
MSRTAITTTLFVALAVPVSAPAAPEQGASPVALAQSGGSVTDGSRALAEAITKGFQRLGRTAAFHRVAVPYFKELGGDTTEHNLGRLVSELIAAELAQRPPFVVVERERLDQVMKEHRLADLGVVDEDTAAKFGRVLGAESLVSGTVAEAGPSYVVTVRQVDVESGKVLVSGTVTFERAGLVALSSDAVEMKSASGAMFRSILLPGWGQFYNEEPAKGAIFMGLGLGSLATAGGFFAAAHSANSSYLGGTPDVVGDRAIANDHIRVTNALLIGYGVVWAVNVVDALISGRSETNVELPESSGAARASD